MHLSLEDFARRRKESQPNYIFDLRGEEEYASAHLPGAHNLPFQHLEANLHRLPFSGDLLFYDGGEGIAAQAGEILYENGFSDYFHVEEGYEALAEHLKQSPYELKLSCTTQDSDEVKREVITNLLNLEINPSVAAHGGHFQLIDVREDSVFVELGGGCQGCGMVDATLRQGVEKRMREIFTGMKELVDVTDHTSGENPYFQPHK